MVVHCNDSTTTSSSTFCKKYLNQKCQRCSVLKKICKNILKNYCRKLCREKYSIFDGGNSINIRIHRSKKTKDSQEDSNTVPRSMVLNPCGNRGTDSERKKYSSDMANGIIKPSDRKKSETGSTQKGNSNSGEKPGAKNSKPTKASTKDKSNQTKLESNVPNGTVLDDGTNGRKKKRKSLQKENLEIINQSSKTEEPTKTFKEKEKSRGKDNKELLNDEDNSRENKKKNKKTNVNNDINLEEQNGGKENKRSSTFKKSKKNTDKDANDSSTKGKSPIENFTETKAKENKNRREISKQEDRLNKTTKDNSPRSRTSAKPLELNSKKSQNLPKKIRISNIIKDLRWKVRNGLDIRDHRGPKSSLKAISPKRKRISFEKKRTDKSSRFDEKPWDILRAAMEQREQ
uniref:Uncharacterized protein n=1 Tax=Musca domestica TaxID=7370 RepID=A0A1I8MHM0_MUSDO